MTHCGLPSDAQINVTAPEGSTYSVSSSNKGKNFFSTYRIFHVFIFEHAALQLKMHDFHFRLFVSF